MRLRSVNLGIALTLSLAATAKAEDRSFMIPYDDPSYEAVMALIGKTDKDAQVSPQKWSAAKVDDRSSMIPYDDPSYEAVLALIGRTESDTQVSQNWSATKVDDRSSMIPYDDPSYEAVLAFLGRTESDAQTSPEDWSAARAQLEAASETTGALPTNPERHITLPADLTPDIPLPADAAQDIGTAAFYPEALSILNIEEAEPLPLQAISSFDLTLTADPLPTAPNWDTL
jgi:hypothetical protein